MSIVRSVSDITNILSSIIQKPRLQNVNVHGEVSVDSDDPPGVFWLRQGGNKIRCFIPDGKIALFAAFLTAGNTVVVNGKITLFYRFSQYQVKVSNIQGAGDPGAKVNVTKITNQISNLVAETPELQNIRIQGEVLEVFSAAVSNWDLCDVGGPPELQIKCVHRGPGPIGALVQKGNNVCAQGNVSIYSSQSLYQIDVTGVGPITENSREQCQCSGCPQCGNPCDRLREVANFESCATCLPCPPDELYKLCPECYAFSPNHETKVAEAVYAYFGEFKTNGFSPHKECHIQFGARNGSADVVLADGNGSFAAIAECKGAGYVGHGIEQLKSYLSATDTRFGIFANTKDREHWKFYENQGKNQFAEIKRSKFEMGVVEGVADRERLRDEIENLKGEIAGLENQKSELHTAIERVSQTKHELTECTSNLTQQIEALENYKPELIAAVEQLTQTEHNLNKRTSDLTQQIEALENYKPGLYEEIHRELDELLEEKMQRVERPLADLKVELQKRGIKNWFKNLFSKENK